MGSGEDSGSAFKSHDKQKRKYGRHIGKKDKSHPQIIEK
jgi:hypothetical protein